MAIVQSTLKSNLSKIFMSVSVICKFDEDPIRNEVAITPTTFSTYVSQRLNNK